MKLFLAMLFVSVASVPAVGQVYYQGGGCYSGACPTAVVTTYRVTPRRLRAAPVFVAPVAVVAPITVAPVAIVAPPAVTYQAAPCCTAVSRAGVVYVRRGFFRPRRAFWMGY